MEAAGANPAEVNMGLTEILLIVLGIFAFVGSFLIPENLAGKASSDIKIPEEMIKDLIAQEVKQAAFQIEEKTDETISAAAEKTERYMERLSNEKIINGFNHNIHNGKCNYSKCCSCSERISTL